MKTIYTVCLLFLIFTGLAGCGATLKETYYLQAHDPATDHSNYFRIKFNGNGYFSKAKFSVGFYDKSAIEQLFSESSLKHAYLSTEVDVFDHATGKRLKEISTLLNAARTKELEIRLDHLRQANASTARLIGQYRTRVETRKNLSAVYKNNIDKAETTRAGAEAELESAFKAATKADKEAFAAKAEAGLKDAYATMEVIRLAMDSKVLVRFFDGAGNPIDVSGKTMVIFVATDISRFAEAIRQLAEAEQTTQDVMKVVFGERIKQAGMIKNKLALQKKYEESLQERLITINTALQNDARLNEDKIKTAVLEAANSAARKKASLFSNSVQITEFAAGLEE